MGLGALVVSQFLAGLINILPGLGVLYFVLGPLEGHFRHEAMFLAVIGGLFLGLGAAIAELFIITGSAPLFVAFALPLVETMAKTMILGLPRFRNNDETVLLGGATGLGLSAMLLIFYGQFVREVPLTPTLTVTLLATAVGFTLAHFISGLELGVGPANGRILGRFLPGYLLLLPAHALFVLGAIDLESGTNLPLTGHVGFAIGMAIYGIALLLVRGPALIRRGLPPPERARWRRQVLRTAREGGE